MGWEQLIWKVTSLEFRKGADFKGHQGFSFAVYNTRGWFYKGNQIL
jgi:hypothetical protein